MSRQSFAGVGGSQMGHPFLLHFPVAPGVLKGHPSGTPLFRASPTSVPQEDQFGADDDPRRLLRIAGWHRDRLEANLLRGYLNVRQRLVDALRVDPTRER